jgi:tetratricopeptide (TPR) repeat protein
MLLTLGALTWRQCGMYANIESLWRSTLARNPDSWLAHNNLGTILRQEGRLDEAITQYQDALTSMPDNESIHFNLARALYQKGSFGEAIRQFQLALQIDPTDIEARHACRRLCRSRAIWRRNSECAKGH